MTVFNNYSALAGTTNQSFQIGGSGGLTIYQGYISPNVSNLVGNQGDLFILLGNSPSILQFSTANGWEVTVGSGGGSGNSGNGSSTLARTKITTTSFTANNSESYLGASLQGTTIYLPAGTPDKTFTIKDESGQAFNQPIVIIPNGSDTIDGASQYSINVNYGSINLIYGDSGWFIF
jgi:hypothetical protein